SAQDMLDACQAWWPHMDGLIAAAAVADQRPERCEAQKVKKVEGPETLTLVRTPDVLATLASVKKPGQWLIGFAAESENHLAHAQAKLQKKGLDAVLLNDVSEGKGFGLQPNTLIPVTPQGPQPALGPAPKAPLAFEIAAWLNELLAQKHEKQS
ncbi:MAG: bifunctional 4'-phosphopantothenoylcysteine decarboxylase/phosphopantothenoylcysteine synthetase, partial [Firmicutes bacterium]|nr:bifunctional 4'-phosphopantothenoylcysteine decarboxylase/phosphopantothenoylcysteine synthetase [Bacillota bacterium]